MSLTCAARGVHDESPRGNSGRRPRFCDGALPSASPTAVFPSVRVDSNLPACECDELRSSILIRKAHILRQAVVGSIHSADCCKPAADGRSSRCISVSAVQFLRTAPPVVSYLRLVAG